ACEYDPHRNHAQTATARDETSSPFVTPDPASSPSSSNAPSRPWRTGSDCSPALPNPSRSRATSRWGSESRSRTPTAKPEFAGPPTGAVVTQHAEAGHQPVVAILNTVIVHIHPLGEARLLLTLDLHVDQHPDLVPVAAPYLGEHVRPASTNFRLRHDLL